MTPEQIDLIRKSFDAMWSMRGDIADLCYSRFFELAPDARDLFPSDAMGEALMWSLECKFGASFTPELRASWRALYATVQVEMRRAAGQA